MPLCTWPPAAYTSSLEYVYMYVCMYAYIYIYIYIYIHVLYSPILRPCAAVLDISSLHVIHLSFMQILHTQLSLSLSFSFSFRPSLSLSIPFLLSLLRARGLYSSTIAFARYYIISYYSGCMYVHIYIYIYTYIYVCMYVCM